MELLANLQLGFGVALAGTNILYCLVGVILGTLIGVLPGIGPVATIAMLLPATFALPPVSALIMLAGIYYGAQYGGSTTAILVNLPGEVSSVVTCLDGYQMARQGQAGKALAIAAIGSFFAGTVATLLVAAFAPPLAELALKFGPADYFSLMVLGLIAAVVLAHGSLIKAVAMIVLGLLIGLIGTDVNSGVARYSFGMAELIDGVGIGPIAMGVFGFGEIIRNLDHGAEKREIFTKKVTGLMPTWKDIRQASGAVVRGTALGSFLGILPGGGPVLGSFSAYTLEKKLSKTPEMFGKGMIEGVAAPESANNAAAQTSFIPLLTLGIPGNASTAMIFAALLIHGITPGPFLLKEHADVFWGVVASMYIGNVMLLILNLPLVGMWVQLLRVPYAFLAPLIMVLTLVGVFSVNNNVFDIWVMLAMGIFGYTARKLKFDLGPLLLAFVLGPIMERSLRQALLISNGKFDIFVAKPISAALLGIAVAFVLYNIWAAQMKKRKARAAAAPPAAP